MEEIYNGFEIKWNEKKYFEFKINDEKILVYTVEQARGTIDRFLKAMKLMNKKVIGFSSENGWKIVVTISRVGIHSERIVHSCTLMPKFFDEKGNMIPTAGPFFEVNNRNNRLVDRFVKIREETNKLIAESDDIWNKLIAGRIDTDKP